MLSWNIPDLVYRCTISRLSHLPKSLMVSHYAQLLTFEEALGLYKIVNSDA